MRQRIVFVLEQAADLVVRFTPHNLPLEDEQGKAIAVVKWRVWTPCAGRPRAESSGLDQLSGKPHWLTLDRLTLEPAAAGGGAAAQEADRDQETAAGAGRHVVPRPGWVLLVTTRPSEQWSDQQVLCLYQARWHIELLFKRIKQLLQQHQLRCTTAATAQPTLTALLLGWALLEEESSAIRLAMRDAMHCTQQAAQESPMQQEATQACWWQEGLNGPLSEWMVTEVSLDLFRQQLRGSYSAARFRTCLPRLQRFLCLGHRNRPHLYSQVYRWLGMPASRVPQRAGVS